MPASYLALHASGELRVRADALLARLTACDLCPRRCGHDRTAGPGECRVGTAVPLARALAHFGEEPPISGSRGSGTVFLGGCNLSCLFCQNHQISQNPGHACARLADREALAAAFLHVQSLGCHNLNLVSGSHVVAQALAALDLAASRGLRLPIVWNSGGYDSQDALDALNGVVDVYLPDMKYADDALASSLSGAKGDYVAVNRAAIRRMLAQVGPLRLDDEGIAESGVLIRHLVLPGHLHNTLGCLTFLAEELGPDVPIAVMAQYYPAHHGPGRPPLDRALTRQEYDQVLSWLDELDIENGFVQDLEATGVCRPDFAADAPFDFSRVKNE